MPLNKEQFDNLLKQSDAGDQMLGIGRFRDTGRKSSGYPEAVDSLIGAPARQGISELQNGNFDIEALKRVVKRIGADPRGAPTGYDIASKVTDNPYLGAGLATAVDVGAQLPTPWLKFGVAGKVISESDGILSKVNSPEVIEKLSGAERANYLNALDEKFGSRAKRASEMGFSPETYYHGTTADIPEFDKGKLGSHTQAPSAPLADPGRPFAD